MKYKSKYSPGKEVTEAQYILEIVCEKKADFEKTNLPLRFWNVPPWDGFFRRNIRQVHKLLKQFSGKAILNAMNRREWQKSYSVFTPRFFKLIQEEQDKLDDEKAVEQVSINRDTLDNKPRKIQKKDTLLSKIEEYE
jgi:hypothetical protein